MFLPFWRIHYLHLLGIRQWKWMRDGLNRKQLAEDELIGGHRVWRAWSTVPEKEKKPIRALVGGADVFVTWIYPSLWCQCINDILSFAEWETIFTIHAVGEGLVQLHHVCPILLLTTYIVWFLCKFCSN